MSETDTIVVIPGDGIGKGVVPEGLRVLEAADATSATGSDGIFHSMPFGNEHFLAVSSQYPGIRADPYHIYILAARFVMSPERFSVVVASDLFGDQVGSGAMILDRLGEPQARTSVRQAIDVFLASPNRNLTPNLSGSATTSELGKAIVSAI